MCTLSIKTCEYWDKRLEDEKNLQGSEGETDRGQISRPGPNQLIARLPVEADGQEKGWAMTLLRILEEVNADPLFGEKQP